MLLALPGIALYRISNGVSRGMKVMKHDLYSKGFTETFGTIAGLLVAMAIGLRNLAPVVAVLFGTGAGGLMAFVLARGLFAEPPRTRAAEREAVDPALLRADRDLQPAQPADHAHGCAACSGFSGRPSA